MSAQASAAAAVMLRLGSVPGVAVADVYDRGPSGGAVGVLDICLRLEAASICPIAIGEILRRCYCAAVEIAPLYQIEFTQIETTKQQKRGR